MTAVEQGCPSVNQGAMRVVTELIDRSDELQVEASTTVAGATVIDMGLRVPGSWEAGRLYAEATMGGLATVTHGLLGTDVSEVIDEAPCDPPGKRCF